MLGTGSHKQSERQEIREDELQRQLRARQKKDSISYFTEPGNGEQLDGCMHGSDRVRFLFYMDHSGCCLEYVFKEVRQQPEYHLGGYWVHPNEK